MALLTLLNGPNLNLLGLRQPEIYGSETLASITERLGEQARALGHDLRSLQSNHEGALIDAIQAARGTSAGIIINPGSLSHTSVGILDALHAFDGPVIEVHISNIHAREPFRHFSYVSARANGVIVGCGVQGYDLALQRLVALVKG